MLSQKFLLRSLIIILAAIDIFLSVLLLSPPKTDFPEGTCAKEMEELCNYNAQLCASDLRTALLEYGIWSKVINNQIGIYITPDPCGVCLSTQLYIIEKFLENYSGNFVFIVPRGMERRIKSSFNYPHDIKLVTYNPDERPQDLLTSFDGVVYFTFINNHLDDIFVSYKTSPESAEVFLNKLL